MKEKILNILIYIAPKGIKEILKRLRLGYFLTTSEDSYLVSSGYVHSILSDSLTNNDNEYVPWMNYPLIEFLKERLNKKHEVFEYGSGSSTFFFAKRTKYVTSIEYDKLWYDKLLCMLNEINNIEILFFELNDMYPLAIENVKKNKKYDIIIIDGRRRVECAKIAYNHLYKNGIVLLDDSQRQHYKDAFTFYKGKGFNQLTFKGLKPTGFGLDSSTIFYRKLNNCLNI